MKVDHNVGMIFIFLIKIKNKTKKQRQRERYTNKIKEATLTITGLMNT